MNNATPPPASLHQFKDKRPACLIARHLYEHPAIVGLENRAVHLPDLARADRDKTAIAVKLGAAGNDDGIATIRFCDGGLDDVLSGPIHLRRPAGICVCQPDSHCCHDGLGKSGF